MMYLFNILCHKKEGKLFHKVDNCFSFQLTDVNLVSEFVEQTGIKENKKTKDKHSIKHIPHLLFPKKMQITYNTNTVYIKMYLINRLSHVIFLHWNVVANQLLHRPAQ